MSFHWITEKRQRQMEKDQANARMALLQLSIILNVRAKGGE